MSERARRRSIPLLLIVCLVLVACSATGGSGPTNTVVSMQPASPGGAAGGYPGWPSGPSSGPDALVPLLVSSDLAPGPNRFLFSLVDGQNRLLASPDLAVRLRFFDLAADPAKPVSETDGRFVWTVEGKQGLYHAAVDFGRAGDWGVEITAGKGGASERSARAVFPVREKSATPALGSPVPRSETPTATDLAAARRISSDAQPDLDFYRRSVKQAVTSGKPSVVVFATPKFCTSRTCGPTLDIVKSVAASYKKRVEFVHVEVYTNLSQPNALQVSPVVAEWGLPTEPWVFVVDANGRLSAKFEGVVGADELREALGRVLQS